MFYFVGRAQGQRLNNNVMSKQYNYAIKFETAVFWILEFVVAKPLNYLLSLRLLRSNKYLLFIWNLIIRMKRTIGITRNRIEALQKAKNGLNRKKNMYDALTQL